MFNWASLLPKEYASDSYLPKEYEKQMEQIWTQGTGWNKAQAQS